MKTDHSMTESSILDESDDSNDGIDSEKTISEEVLRGSLEKNRSFLVKFLHRKCCELGNRRASQRTINIDTQAAGRSPFKIKKGERIFHVRVENTSEEEEDGDSLAKEFEKTFLGQMMNKPTQGGERKKVKKYPPKDCPLKCGARHPNGSVFFCKTFRAKSMDERKAFCKNISLSVLCLSSKSKTHTCVVQSCPRFYSSHNILLCPQEAEEALLTAREGDDDGSEDEAMMDAYSSNQIAKNLNLVIVGSGS